MSIKWKSKRGSLPGLEQLSTERAKRGLLHDALRRNEQRDMAFRRMILSIPICALNSELSSLHFGLDPGRLFITCAGVLGFFLRL
jgi:hypothetical protein